MQLMIVIDLLNKLVSEKQNFFLRTINKKTTAGMNIDEYLQKPVLQLYFKKRHCHNEVAEARMKFK